MDQTVDVFVVFYICSIGVLIQCEDI